MDPHPRTAEMVYDVDTATRLKSMFRVAEHIGEPAPDDEVDRLLPEVSVIIGQTRMDAVRLERAPKLRAIVNVLGNWRPNIDYVRASELGVHVLSAAPAMAPAVAEWTLAALLDLRRGVTACDRKFRAGEERYGIEGCRASRTLRGSWLGMVGFGNLGRELLKLVEPFGCEVLVHDPWLPPDFLKEMGVVPTGLEELLSTCDSIVILAGATTENQGFLDRELLGMVTPDTSVVLASRAAVVDFDALVEYAGKGRFRLAVDVFPSEPVGKDSLWRDMGQILWSSHVAGADPSSYALMREMVVEDVAQVISGNRPMRLQAADPQRAAMMNSI